MALAAGALQHPTMPEVLRRGRAVPFRFRGTRQGHLRSAQRPRPCCPEKYPRRRHAPGYGGRRQGALIAGALRS